MTGATWIVGALVTSGTIAILELVRRHVVGARFVRLQRMAPR
jgi:hypothetical protein